MLKKIAILVCCTFTITALAVAQSRNGVNARKVYTPKDGKPFVVRVVGSSSAVSASTTRFGGPSFAEPIVRLSAPIPAGGSIKVALDGKARIVNENLVYEASNAELSEVAAIHEIEVEPLGDGKVVVTFTILPHMGEPSAKIYQFEVKGFEEWGRRSLGKTER